MIDGGAGPSHVVAGADSRFYVADTGGDAILVYEGPAAAIRACSTGPTFPGSPYGLAIDNRRGDALGDPHRRNEPRR